MSAFLEACFQNPINLVFSVLLILLGAYWLLVSLGALGIDSLDFDFEPDLDVDADVDATSFGGAGVGASILRFFGVGEVPLLLLLSVFVLTMWAIGVLAHPYIGAWPLLVQLPLVIPMAIVAAMITQVVTTPLRTLFRRMRQLEVQEQQLDLIGKTCRVVSLTADAGHGQVEVDTTGSPLRLTVRTADADAVLHKGDEAVLVAEDRASGGYVIRAFDFNPASLTPGTPS